MPSLLDLSVRLKTTNNDALAHPPNRILVVDDDALVRELEATLMRRAGHQVDIAPDAEAGWHALRANDYDLLLTDYQMPHMSGLDLIRQIRAAHMAIPVVMVSGSLESLDIALLSGSPLNIHAFVQKPFTSSQLLGAVNSALPPGDTGARAPRIALA